ncbi:hypothetical protein QUA56_07810 [Microcoleus sp. N3A4]
MHVPNEAKRAYAVKPFYRGKKVAVIGAISLSSSSGIDEPG